MRELSMIEVESVAGGEVGYASCKAGDLEYSHGFTLVTLVPNGYTTQTCYDGYWGSYMFYPAQTSGTH